MKISVVVPVYNGAPTVARTLAALRDLDAGPDDVEVIVVDDGSTDGTARIVEGFPVRLVRQANGGPAKARNAGWRSAGGEIIVFTDGDCIPPRGWLRCLLPHFADERVGAVAGSYDIANPGSLLARVIQAEIAYRHRRMAGFVKAGGTYNLAVRRSILEAVGGLDENFPAASGEDNDLSYRILKQGWRIAFRPECRVAHLHPERLGKYLRTQFIHGFWRSRLYHCHPEFMRGDDYTRAKDVVEFFLAAFSLFLLLFLPGFPLLAGRCLGVLSVILLAIEIWTAGVMARESGWWQVAPAGAAVFTLRSYCRFLGWLWGEINGGRRPAARPGRVADE